MKSSNLSGTVNNYSGILVGVVTVIGAVLPIFSSQYLSHVFVDNQTILFISIMGLTVLVLTAWFCYSIDFFILLNGRFDKVSKYRVGAIALMLISIVIIYGLKTIYESDEIGFNLASILQTVFYLLLFASAGITFGTTLQSTITASRNRRIQEEWNERIINTLSKQGYINLNLKILTFSQHLPQQGEMGEMTSGYDVDVMIGDKHYYLQFTYDLERVVRSIDYDTLAQTQQALSKNSSTPDFLSSKES